MDGFDNTYDWLSRFLGEEYSKYVYEEAAAKDISVKQVLRQSLRIYQMYQAGLLLSAPKRGKCMGDKE